MGWKDFPYWLKGGIIGVGLAIILFMINIFSGLGCMQAYNFKEPSLICDLIRLFDQLEILRYLIHPVFIIILSTLIGFFIGKIKSGKSEIYTQKDVSSPKKYLLKGGIIGLGIGMFYFLLIFITFLLSSDPSESTGISAKIGILNIILISPFYFIFSPIKDYFLSFAKLFFSIVLVSSVLGVLIGWLIGKIKSK